MEKIQLTRVKFDLPEFEQTKARQIIQEQSIRIAKALDEHIKTQLMFASPKPIKEPLTSGKMKWHGIKLCVKNVGAFGKLYWLEQRGVKIGSAFELKDISL